MGLGLEFLALWSPKRFRGIIPILNISGINSAHSDLWASPANEGPDHSYDDFPTRENLLVYLARNLTKHNAFLELVP